MHSWVRVVEGQIVAHAALVRKSESRFELGRWVAYKNAPRGAITELCRLALNFADSKMVHVECTQAHTSSQAICERLGLRFAGLGILGPPSHWLGGSKLFTYEYHQNRKTSSSSLGYSI